MARRGRAVIVGAGVGGLGTALALSRTGHDVVVLERDDTPVPDTLEEAARWERKGAPQFHHSHVFLPRSRHILKQRFPEVYQALIDAGAPERPMGQMMGVTPDMPGFDDLMHLPCRRTVYEWVLRKSLDVEVRTGVSVAGLEATTDDQGIPTVSGARLASGEVVGGDIVVACTGRRGDVPSWLDPLGASIPETVVETASNYMSRFYRIKPGHEPPEFGYRTGRRAGIGMLGYEADNQTFSVTLVIDPTDSELRRHLLDEQRYDATCRLLPELAPLVEPAEPITPVHIAAGLINRKRDYLDEGGTPKVHNFFAVGDAHTITNPVYGRGCTLALVQAVLLADALGESDGDPAAAVTRYEEGSAREVVPWYHVSVMMDATARSADDGADFVGGQNSPIAALENPKAIMTLARVFGLLDPPGEVFDDPELVKIFTDASAARRRAKPPEGPRITRQDILNVRI